MSTLAIDPVPVGPRPAFRIRPTLILIAAFLAMALWGAMVQRHAAHSASATLPRPTSPAVIYLSLMVMEWGLVLYVWRVGLRGSATTLRDLIGGRWGRASDVARDAAIALATWGAWTLVGWLWERAAGPSSAASVQSLLPHRPHEIALWVALSMSAGFSEELVFRGYLLRQLQSLTRSATLGVLLQAVLFGVSHGYQGVRACLSITVYGLLFGWLAVSRKSLRPGMLAHAWTDVASGIFRI